MKVTVGEIRQIIKEEKEKLRSELEMNETLAEVDSILSEAVREGEAERGAKVVEGLNKFKGKGLNSVDVAVGKMVPEINKFLAQGAVRRAFAFGQSPLDKGEQLEQCLKTGFMQLSNIMKINGIDLTKDADSVVSSHVVRGGPTFKSFNAAVSKAFQKDGVFKSPPYLDLNTLVNEVLEKKVSEVVALAAVGKSVEVPATPAAPTAGEAGKPAEPAAGGEAKDEKTPAAGSAMTKEQLAALVKQVVDATGQKRDIVARVVSNLNKAGKLKP